ncbi:MAG: MmgE/PrpD family protein [Dehalococcoidia bacterium]
MSDQQQPITAALADFCRGIRYEDLPPDAITVAKQCLLDWLAVTIAGADQPLTQILRAEALEQGGNPQATLIGSGERVTASQAALVNGAASHALDYDDVHLAMSGHPSVPIWPALIALAEQRGASGRDVLAAFVAGVEMECRIGLYVMPGHYSTGFHATGTLGTFGAAAACAHLMGLDRNQWLNALGIAGAQAAGLKSMFGTMCKPLHAGKAAQNGLAAATLAARGFTSNPEVLETHQGFAATQTTTPNPEAALSGLGDRYAVRDVLFKYHAACYGTHETIEAILRLKEQNAVVAGDVERILLTVPRGHLSMCNIQEPSTPLEGKFSLRFTAALALVTGDASEQAFTPAAVREPALTSVRDRVTVESRTGSADWDGTRVSLALSDGRRLEESVDLNIPASDLDVQWERLTTKFASLAANRLATDAVDAVRQSIRDFDRLNIADLVALAAPSRTALVR